MAKYININGTNIPIRANDPSNPQIGEIWYNSTSNSLKGQINFASAAMSTKANMNNTRGQNGCSHNGTTNASLSVAGNNQGGPLVNNNSEKYDGTSWTASGTYPQATFGAYGSGTQTAALFCGGRIGSSPYPVTAVSASYNGSTFSGEGNLSQARQSIGTFGATETSAIAAGGHNPSNYTDTEEYNGSAWTAIPATFPSQDNMGACGTSTAAIANQNGGTAYYTFDGSTWTSGPASMLATGSLNQALVGTSTACNALGANSAPNLNERIQSFDGTSWSTSPATLNVARSQAAGQGTSTSALLFGGTSTAYLNATEEFTGAGPATVTISSS